MHGRLLVKRWLTMVMAINVSLAGDVGGQAAWKGKLVNGKPNGTWQFNLNSNGLVKVINTEIFKDGLFVKGVSITGNYKNASRIVLVPTAVLPFLQAENLAISSYPCNANTTIFTEKIKKNDDNVYLDAHYEENEYDFRRELYQSIKNQFNKDGNFYYGSFEANVTAEVDEYGKFINVKTKGVIALTEHGFTSAFSHLPILKPATINGKPVKQKFTLTYSFDVNTYRPKIDFKFLPLDNQ